VQCAGVGQKKCEGDDRQRTPVRKIRAQFDSYKHISLALPVGKPLEVRLVSAQKRCSCGFMPDVVEIIHSSSAGVM
jgi:hypothetical protein